MKNATELGRPHGLNGQETNMLLYQQGFICGEPGDYDFTDKGQKYGISKEHHRGTGGYSRFNRYWTTTKYDESIESVIDWSPATIEKACQAVKERSVSVKNNSINNLNTQMHNDDKVVVDEPQSLQSSESPQIINNDNNIMNAIYKGVNVATTVVFIGEQLYKIYKIPVVEGFIKCKIVPGIKKIFNASKDKSNIEKQNYK